MHVDKNKSLTWLMTQTMDDWMGTEVGFVLENKTDHTQVTFFHKNWKEASEHFGIATFCWGNYLTGLKIMWRKELLFHMLKGIDFE